MKILVFIFVFVSIISFGQVKPSNDTTKISLHSAKKAAILSMIIPGAGQVYNQYYSPKGKYGAYWRLPIIYSSLLGTGKLLFDAIDLEKELRIEYYNRDNSNAIISPKWANYSQSDLIILHESAVKKRTLYMLLVGGVYALQIIDASVEAHFLHFDITPSISMQIQPAFYQNTAGLNLCFNFN